MVCFMSCISPNNRLWGDSCSFLKLEVTSQPLQTSDFCKILINFLFGETCRRILWADMQASCSVGQWEEGGFSHVCVSVAWWKNPAADKTKYSRFSPGINPRSLITPCYLGQTGFCFCFFLNLPEPPLLVCEMERMSPLIKAVINIRCL